MDLLAALPEIDLPSSSFHVEEAGQERRLISSLRRPHRIEARGQESGAGAVQVGLRTESNSTPACNSNPVTEKAFRV